MQKSNAGVVVIVLGVLALIGFMYWNSQQAANNTTIDINTKWGNGNLKLPWFKEVEENLDHKPIPKDQEAWMDSAFNRIWDMAMSKLFGKNSPLRDPMAKVVDWVEIWSPWIKGWFMVMGIAACVGIACGADYLYRRWLA